MTKARDLADLISAGNPLADGAIAYSEVTGTPTLATVATTVTVTENNTEAANLFPTFVDLQTGAQDIETDVGLTYNPSTGVLTATTFNGTVTGGRAYAFFLSQENHG